jgi:RNA polymerase sigma factor (sigma-70 family)
MALRKRRPQETLFSDSINDQTAGVPEIPDSRLTPEESYSRRERQQILAAAVDRLKSGLRAVIHLQLAGFSPLETSEVLGITLSAAKSRLSHARAKLRRGLRAALRPATPRSTARQAQQTPIRGRLLTASEVGGL